MLQGFLNLVRQPHPDPNVLLIPETQVFDPIAEGWRALDCAAGNKPLAASGGFLTAGDKESILAAESYGWVKSWNGECFAWTAPRIFGGSVDPMKIPKVGSAVGGMGWWRQAWYLQ